MPCDVRYPDEFLLSGEIKETFLERSFTPILKKLAHHAEKDDGCILIRMRHLFDIV